MSETKSRAVFKKPKNKNKRILAKKRKLDDDEFDDNETIGTHEKSSSEHANAASMSKTGDNIEHDSTSTLMKIQQMKKARKIKNQYRAQKQSKSSKHPSNRNADAVTKEEEEKEQLLVEANQDLKQRLEGNFAINGPSANDGDGNVLTQKHKLAMEQFINSQMENGSTTDDQHAGSAEGESNQRKEINNTNDLYAQILQQSTELLNTESEPKAGEGDVGAGGSMLGGTGIAEIVLPVEDRINAAKETEFAAARLERSRKTRSRQYDNTGAPTNQSIQIEKDVSQLLPMSFGSGPGKNKKQAAKSNTLSHEPSESVNPAPTILAGRTLNQDILPDIGSSYAHNFRLHNVEWISNKKKQEQENDTTIVVEEKDDSRVGFEVSRGLKSERVDDSANGRKAKRANDNRTYKKFLKREFKNNRR